MLSWKVQPLPKLRLAIVMTKRKSQYWGRCHWLLDSGVWLFNSLAREGAEGHVTELPKETLV